MLYFPGIEIYDSCGSAFRTAAILRQRLYSADCENVTSSDTDPTVVGKTKTTLRTYRSVFITFLYYVKLDIYIGILAVWVAHQNTSFKSAPAHITQRLTGLSTH